MEKNSSRELYYGYFTNSDPLNPNMMFIKLYKGNMKNQRRKTEICAFPRWHLLSGRGDTWSTYVRPSRSHLPFCVRRTLIGYTEKIHTWVYIFSLSGADLPGQCHSQFEMDRINLCGIFETICVIQGQDGLPQSRFKTNESTVLASKWCAFLHFTW